MELKLTRDELLEARADDRAQRAYVKYLTLKIKKTKTKETDTEQGKNIGG